MSASTASISASQGPITRRRAIEKNLASATSDLPVPEINAGETAAAILRETTKTHVQTQPKKSSRKSTKPGWQTAISIITKNLALLVVLFGFVQMIRLVVLNSTGSVSDYSVINGEFEGKFFEVEKFVKTTMKTMQVQVNAIDRKIEEGIGSVRKEFDEKLDRKVDELDLKFKSLDVRSDVFEKFVDEFRSKSLLSKEEFGDFFDEFKKSRKNRGGVDGGDVSLDEIKDYARGILEKELEKHAADGLGMADYALVTGGGRVLSHSKQFGGMKGLLFRNRNGVSSDAVKMIRPSFGEPGDCFPLDGSSGFVVIRLRSAIIPEAVTLEHVAKSVAYDRSSAPKDCKVSGWLQGKDVTDSEIYTKNMFLLTEFTYDLEKSNVQTFKVKSTASGPVDTIKLDIASNHGSAFHTCIYRLRVHGHEPGSSVPVVEM